LYIAGPNWNWRTIYELKSLCEGFLNSKGTCQICTQSVYNTVGFVDKCIVCGSLVHNKCLGHSDLDSHSHCKCGSKCSFDIIFHVGNCADPDSDNLIAITRATNFVRSYCTSYMGLAPAYASTGLELFSMQMAAFGKFPETLHDNHMLDVIKMFLPSRKLHLPQLVPPGYEMTHSYLSYVKSPHAHATLLHQVSEICVSVLGPLYSFELISKGSSILRKRSDPNQNIAQVNGNPSSKRICRDEETESIKKCAEDTDNADFDETTSKEDHSTGSPWLSSDPSDDSEEDTDGSYVPSDTSHPSYSSTESNYNIESEQDQEPSWNTDDEASS
jgi:hypothetical protein